MFTLMNRDRYFIKKSLDYQIFAFVSEGRYGKLFRLINLEGLTEQKTLSI